MIAARVRATEALRSAFTRHRKDEPVSCPQTDLGAIRYDARTYALKPGQGGVGLSTVAGRIKVPFTADAHAKGILDQAVGMDSADLLFRKGRFWLHVVVTLPEVEFHPSGRVVGVDLGLSRPAVCSHNRFFGERRRTIPFGTRWRSCTDWKGIERRYFRLRRSLQRKGTRSARRHLRKLAGKVNRFRRDCDHVLSRRIVDSVQPGTVIVVENLVEIRKRTQQRGRASGCTSECESRRGSAPRRRLHSWSFAQLRGFLSYKAEARGCRVVEVDPPPHLADLRLLRTYPSFQSSLPVTVSLPGLRVRVERRPERGAQYRPEVPGQRWYSCRGRAAVNRPIVPACAGGLGASPRLPATAWRGVGWLTTLGSRLMRCKSSLSVMASVWHQCPPK